MKRSRCPRTLLLSVLVLFILLGRSGQLDLQGAEVILHFDQDGRLLPPQPSTTETGGQVPDADVQALMATLRDLPVRLAGKALGTFRGQARIVSRNGTATYDLSGEGLGGRFHLRGKWLARSGSPLVLVQAGDEPEGLFTLEGARLSRLWNAFRLGDRLGALEGTVSITLPFRHEGPDRRPVGRGRFAIRNIRWQGQDITDALTGDLILTADALQLQNLNAGIGEGILRGVIVYNLRDPERSYFNLTLDRVDAARLLMPLGLDGRVQGAVDAHVRGRLGREWRGSGSVVLTRGRLLDVEVNELRLPLEFAFSPVSGNGELMIRDGAAQLGQGHATTEVNIIWAGGTRVQGSIRFFDAQLSRLLGTTGESSTFGAGRITGRIDFGGADVRSVNDLTADIQATLRQAQATQLPLLETIFPRIPGLSPSSTFQSGDFRGRLAGGVLRIQRWTLSGPTIQAIFEGTVTLQGLLNLDVTVRPGLSGANNACLLLLALRLPIAGPIPIGLIARASTALSTSVIHLRVTGTYRNPVVRVEPIRILTEEAVRFFLISAAVPAS